MSNQEKVLNALDKVKLSGVDFKAYMASRAEGEANVKSPFEYTQELIDRITGKTEDIGSKMPWEYTHDKFRFRPGEVTVVMGYNGSYKSMVTGYIGLGLIEQGEKICIASFEMKPASTLERIVKQATGKNKPTIKDLDEFLVWSEGKLWLYDQQGSVKPDLVIGVIYYCAEQLGVTHFFIDSLMRCVKSEDDFTGQKDFMEKLCVAAMDLNIHITVVHHSRKRQDESERPGKMDSKGSGSIVDQAFNMIVVFKVPEEKKMPDSPDAGLYIDKQRNGEWQGQVMLYMNKESLQFHGDRRDSVRSFLT